MRCIAKLAIACSLMAAATTSVSAVELVSIAPNGAPIAQSYDAIPSATGRFVVFLQDVFPTAGGSCGVQWVIRDRQLGVSEFVSRTAAGELATCTTAANAVTTVGADVSADGRFVVFDFRAGNLGAPGENAILLKDRQDGSITVLSDDGAVLPSVDESGRYVLFERSRPSKQLIRLDRVTGAEVDIVGSSAFLTFQYALSGDGNRVAYLGASTSGAAQIYVFDVTTGTRTIASDRFGVPANGTVFSPALDFDGDVVAFESEAPNLNGGFTAKQIIRRSLAEASGEVVSRAADGQAAFGFPVDSPSVSGDGDLIAFRAFAANLPGGTAAPPFLPQVYVFDVRQGVPLLISVDDTGAPANRGSSIQRCEDVAVGPPCSITFAISPRISANGSVVAFHSDSTNLSPLDPDPNTPDVYVVPVPAGSSPGAAYPVPSLDERVAKLLAVAFALIGGVTLHRPRGGRA